MPGTSYGVWFWVGFVFWVLVGLALLGRLLGLFVVAFGAGGVFVFFVVWWVVGCVGCLWGGLWVFGVGLCWGGCFCCVGGVVGVFVVARGVLGFLGLAGGVWCGFFVCCVGVCWLVFCLWFWWGLWFGVLLVVWVIGSNLPLDIVVLLADLLWYGAAKMSVV
ncbi:hypothetical protein [Pseudomonas syringae group genomosp. 7]|uniref:hypothetical protein n=1 Tax=Pseudomonas syringae group genomosp. 7 TaxID=251699 RepID=UPI0037702D70